MHNHDEHPGDPEDAFEADEPESLDARIRAGDEIDPDELDDTDPEAMDNYLEHLEELKNPPKPVEPLPYPFLPDDEDEVANDEDEKYEQG